MKIIEKDLSISDEIEFFLEGFSSEPLSSNYFKHFQGGSIPLQETSISLRDLEILEHIQIYRNPDQGVNVLLVGPPGTGKTEFVRAFSRHFGKKLYEVRSLGVDSDDDTKYFRFRALKACQNASEGDPDVIITIDEAEDLLASGRGFMSFGGEQEKKKALINEALDSAKSTQIWVCNRDDQMDESTRRRFDYIVFFSRANPCQRKSIWKNILRRNGLDSLFTSDEIEKYAEEFPVEAAGIEISIRNVRNLARTAGGKKKAGQIVRQLLKTYHKNNCPPEKGCWKGLINSRDACIDGLNISDSTQFSRLCRLLDARKTQIDDSPANDERPGPVKILLAGPPGTGKTFFAGYVASILKKPLVVKTASDILSPWLGISEGAIRKAFDEAERENAVLFFDEIDGLLQSRSRARNSWEVTIVNELLSGLETFSGIFIAATNFAELVDNGALRRFHFKLRFDPLTPEGNIKMYKRVLADLVRLPLATEHLENLRKISQLVPADFAMVREQMTLAGTSGLIHPALIQALRLEMEGRTQKSGTRGIGFNV